MPDQAGAPRALIVDDSAIFQLVASELLNDAGLDVGAVVPTAEEAIALIDDGLEIDLVLMDVQLPGLAGPDAIPVIRRRRPDLPILLTSALEPGDLADAVACSGATAFIAKSALDTDAVRSVLHR